MISFFSRLYTSPVINCCLCIIFSLVTSGSSWVYTSLPNTIFCNTSLITWHDSLYQILPSITSALPAMSASVDVHASVCSELLSTTLAVAATLRSSPNFLYIFLSFCRSSGPINVRRQGTLRSLRGKSLLLLLFPVTVQDIDLCCCSKSEQTHEIVRGTWPIVSTVFITVTTKGSSLLPLSRTRSRFSPM